ncbi:hypothetical protein [Streptococcus thoraltensis]|uniref:hypothetical protein n=1 Tax=Streptococcus thoraltensis TaxID=55085 RepID=UPI001F59E460|nr:hypothetical protein [Streptococcus thoraltensis]
MTNLARINLHLSDEVLTINAAYLLHIGMVKKQDERLSALQLHFKAEFWQERGEFPDKGYLLEKAALGRAIESISFLDQMGQLSFYDLPYFSDNFGSNSLQKTSLLEDGSLVIDVKENLRTFSIKHQFQ